MYACIRVHVRAFVTVSLLLQDQLLKKGMVILREKIKNEQGMERTVCTLSNGDEDDDLLSTKKKKVTFY